MNATPSNTSLVKFNNGHSLVSKTGKVIGSLQRFSGQGKSASEIRAELRAQGLKGATLTKEINSVLAGEKDLRWARHDAAISLMRSAGYVPDEAVAKTRSGYVKYVKPVEPTSRKKVDEEAALAALGMTKAEWDLLKSLRTSKA